MDSISNYYREYMELLLLIVRRTVIPVKVPLPMKMIGMEGNMN